MKQVVFSLLKLGLGSVGYLYSANAITYAQVIPDGTVNTQVNQNGNVSEITGGEAREGNLFHSFQDFSVGTGNEAFFNNADSITNIFSRVTGGNISNIDGLIRANGSASLFLINPAGIMFGENASLNIGGSFLGSSADSILFPDGIEFSASDTSVEPILTINAPIGLSFRDNPGDIVNRSSVTDETGEDLIGLRVFEDETLALIGGNVFIEGGILSTIGGQIELGSVADNSNVSITPVEKGFDFGYEEVSSFQDINLSFAALVNNLEANTGNIEVQGKDISLIEGSGIGITTEFEGRAGDINIIASESLTLNGNGIEVDIGEGDIITSIYSQVFDDATGEGSSINIDAPVLNITNGAQIFATNDIGNGQGVGVNITASEINLGQPFDGSIPSGIVAQVFEEGVGDGGDISITTDRLNINEGAQITTDTFGVGNGGNLNIDASESIELTGTIPNSNSPSALFANVGIPEFPISSAGDGGDITINAPRLVVNDGAQIGTTAQNDGNGGNLTINASEFVLLSGFSDLAEFRGEGISGLFVSAEPSFEETDFDETGDIIFTGEIIPTTGNGGTLDLTTEELIVENGASISADTFSLGAGGNANINVNNLVVRNGSEIRAGSLFGVDNIDTERGNGGTLNINASNSFEVTGTGDINGTQVNSSLLTLAESNGDAGNLILSTNQLSVSDGGEINASALEEGAAGNLDINAEGIDLQDGSIVASTRGGTGGEITLNIAENLTLRENSLVSARAFEDASGGNIFIDSQFIVAFPNSTPGNGSDIIANAQQGDGGNINITAESLFGIQERTATDENGTNDIDASSQFGLDGSVSITTPDLNAIQGDRDLPNNLIAVEQTKAQACRSDRASAKESGLTVKGKGGVPAEPTAPFTADSILVNGQTNTQSKQIQHPDITSIPTSIGNITPARGMIKTEDGRVILTAYRTNYSDRSPDSQLNCAL